MTPEFREGCERIAALPETLGNIAVKFAAQLKAIENEYLEKARQIMKERRAAQTAHKAGV